MVQNTSPIKRNESLKDLSRDHHYGLLLCWKIRTGLKNVDHQRVKAYADYFFAEFLLPHFKLEEKYVFPLLGEESTLVQTAMDDHKKLRTLFAEKENVLESLVQIETLLEKHIRFEERVLFKELQRIIPEELIYDTLSRHDALPREDNWDDKFWEISKR